MARRRRRRRARRWMIDRIKARRAEAEMLQAYEAGYGTGKVGPARHTWQYIFDAGHTGQYVFTAVSLIGFKLCHARNVDKDED